MERKDESSDLSFEDFKPQKQEIKCEKKIDSKGNSKSLSPKDSSFNGTVVDNSTATICMVCKGSVERDEMECHLSSCIEKYKHSSEKEAERKSSVGKRKEQFCCFLCNQTFTSLSFQQREEHVNKCLNKQEAKRKWKELGLSENRKKPKASSIMGCPVCEQKFASTEARHSHLKTCGAKHNMSTIQLIEAVRLQEKHAKEQKDAGLPPVASSTRTVLRKSTRQKQFKPRQPKDKNEEDLQTALALSASLSECLNNKIGKELNSEHSDDMDLQFTSSSEDKHVMRLHSHREQKTIKRKMLKSKTTPVLLQRKEEERIKLLEERVSNLLSAEMPVCCAKCNDKDTTKKPFQKRRTISDTAVNDRSLWTFSSQKGIAQDDFYVLSLSDLVSPSKVQAGSKIRRLSQLPGSSLSQKLPARCSLQYNETSNEKSEVSTQQCINFILEDEDDTFGKDEEKKAEIGGFCFKKEEYSLPPEQDHELNPNIKSSLKLALAFRSLVGKEDYSDISVITENGEKCIPAHSLILNVRCPDIMKDVKSSHDNGTKLFLDWKEIYSDAALAFLEVIYSGNTFSPLNNEDHVKKLINRYSAQPLFQDLQIFLEIESKQSKFEKSERKELNDVLNKIWEKSDDTFQDNVETMVETQGDSDTDDLENVYLYLTQKQGGKVKCKEAEDDEEMESCDLLGNSLTTNGDSICVMQENSIDNNSKLSSELSIISRNNSSYELSVSPKKSSARMARKNMRNNYSAQLFDSKSDVEMKLSKSIDELQSIDLKEENITQTKSSSSFSSLQDSPYHFSEEDDYLHEKYSSPTKRFGRKTHFEFASDFDVSSPVKSPFKKGQRNSTLISDQLLSGQCSSSNASSTKTGYTRSKYSPKKTQEKEIYNYNKSPKHHTKSTLHSSAPYKISQQKSSVPQSPLKLSQCVRMQSPLKPSPVKSKETLNNSKKECFEENDIHCDVWEDFHDNGYEFMADMNDNNFDDNRTENQQITENMSPLPEVVTSSRMIEVHKSFKLPTPPPDKGNNLPSSNKKRRDSSPWKENGIKEGPPLKRKVNTYNKDAKARNSVTPIPNYNQMVTPELKECCAKYGVKKLPRKKAVAVLTHIYEKTHPFFTDSEYETSTPISQRPSVEESGLNNSDKKQGHCKEAKSKPKRKLKQLSQKEQVRTNLSQKLNESMEMENVLSGVKCRQQNSSNATSIRDSRELTGEQDSENPLKDADLDEQPSSQTSSQSEASDMLEESLLTEVENNSSDEKDIRKRLHSYIQKDVELYEKILKYEPVDLMEFHKHVKESGIKVSTAGLMDFFDEECITFSIPRDEKTKEKQKRRTKRYQKRRATAIAKQDH